MYNLFCRKFLSTSLYSVLSGLSFNRCIYKLVKNVLCIKYLKCYMCNMLMYNKMSATIKNLIELCSLLDYNPISLLLVHNACKNIKFPLSCHAEIDKKYVKMQPHSDLAQKEEPLRN